MWDAESDLDHYENERKKCEQMDIVTMSYNDHCGHSATRNMKLHSNAWQTPGDK